MSMKDAIESKLSARFLPERMEVIDESHLHAGHQGGKIDGSGETHFRVRIVSQAFSSINRIGRHRAVNEALAEELAGTLHALAVEPSAPGEAVKW